MNGLNIDITCANSPQAIGRLVKELRLLGISNVEGDGAEVVENKRLGPALELIPALQAEREVSRSQKAPRRTVQTDQMF